LRTKSGTKYEMLAALVFKLLNESGVVIHDLHLTGETDTKAQIDVSIKEHETNRRILIECKDYDISGDPVGIGIVRCFWAVVEDTKPDTGIIITCNGFTRDAKKYAKAKGIKLAVLREFRKEDYEDRILSFNIHILEKSWTNPRPFLGFSKEEYLKKWQDDLDDAGIITKDVFRSDRIFIKTPNGRFILHKFVDDVLNGYSRETAGHVKHKVPIDGSSIEIENKGEIPISALIIDFDIVHRDYFLEFASEKIATLILERLQEGDDIVFCGEDIERYEIDPDSGEVKPRK
jgi:hypothetical protein